jgi:hypothetical protein
MSTDFENELRDLLREKAGEAPLATPSLPASAPRQVLRRGRLHQVGTVLGSAAVVVALIVGSVAGLTRILGEGPDAFDTGGYEVFQRTATIEAFTVTSPSDWYLVNQWPLSMVIAVEGSGGSSSACVAVPGNVVQECNDTPGEVTSSPIPVPYGLPMFQLSNVDLGVDTNACEEGVPDEGVALYVALDYDRAIAGIADPSIGRWPAELEEPGAAGGACGAGRYAHFTVNGEPFFAWLGTGEGVSEEDRTAVETSFETMSAIPDWTPSPPDQTTPGYVIAGGASESGESWRLELRPGSPNLDLSLARADRALVRLPLDEALSGSSFEPDPTDPIFGAIVKRATGVEFRPGEENVYLDLGESPVAGTIVPLPPSLGAADFDLFFIDPPEGYADLGGHVIALGLAEPSAEPSVSAPPVAEARGDEVVLSGAYDDQPWLVRFTGAFAEGTACIHVTIVRPSEPNCHEHVDTTLAGDQPWTDSWTADTLHLQVISVVSEVVELRFTSDDDLLVPWEFQCAMGPLGWTDPDRRVCVIALPPDGSGTLEFLDAKRRVLFGNGMGWGAAEPEVAGPVPVDPVHGGTYWAVYPWLGSPGSPEADDVSAQLLAEFRIEAFPGDLACDEGAAAALGTDAEQGIGVYFETEDEASAFALQAGLLGHEGDPLIARVTTYCLD